MPLTDGSNIAHVAADQRAAVGRRSCSPIGLKRTCASSRHRRRTYPRPRRSRSRRHEYPDRQALALYRLRRRAAAIPITRRARERRMENWANSRTAVIESRGPRRFLIRRRQMQVLSKCIMILISLTSVPSAPISRQSGSSYRLGGIASTYSRYPAWCDRSDFKRPCETVVTAPDGQGATFTRFIVRTKDSECLRSLSRCSR